MAAVHMTQPRAKWLPESTFLRAFCAPSWRAVGGEETGDEDTVLREHDDADISFPPSSCPVVGSVVAYWAVKGITTTSTIKTMPVPSQ